MTNSIIQPVRTAAILRLLAGLHIYIGWSLVVDIALSLAHGLGASPSDEAARLM
ncbi:MAG TPA: hypothetical protein VEO92_02425 [Candidatus Nitrosocosmicus sp.]|nr:hypothetical protein [Candidatus Nitrosocosmicus sp.]